MLLTNNPNPLTSRTTLNFSLGNPGPINITIYDINGKVVWNLENTWYNSGSSHIVWEGRDNQGNKVMPGVYACRLVAGNYSESILIIVQ
ncbi:MAG: T9SS type A sorting domain-containing protein [Bacteroidetes bacterium]|nr:T9SS type A sorting domain-containing protein [Bacteroidota bacterium]